MSWFRKDLPPLTLAPVLTDRELAINTLRNLAQYGAEDANVQLEAARTLLEISKAES